MAARDPKDLGRLFAERVNRGDLEGLAKLYEIGAKFIAGDGRELDGRDAIRSNLEQLLALSPRITSSDGRAVRSGDLALLSSRWHMTFGSGEAEDRDAEEAENQASREREQAGASLEGVSTEVARCQDDGSWLYLIDDPYSATLHASEALHP